MNTSPLSLRNSIFTADTMRAVELGVNDIPALQQLFAENPDYFLQVNGELPRRDEAQREFDDLPPAGMPFARRWLLGFVDEAEAMIGIASVLSDLLADRVWHIGLFVIATPLHGTGASHRLYRGLEEWMRANGARWVRLGAVEGNARAERFWEKMSYTEVRKRKVAATSERTNSVRVMVKSLGEGTLAEYLSLVARDRPDAP